MTQQMRVVMEDFALAISSIEALVVRVPRKEPSGNERPKPKPMAAELKRESV